MSIQKIKNRIIVAELEYMGANLSCINTNQGLVLIDTPYLPHEIRKWQEVISKFSNNKEIAYVINTDFHFDHCTANTLLSPNVVAHESTYQEMLKPDGTMRHSLLPTNNLVSPELREQVYQIPIGLPRLTFAEHLWLHLGDANFELVHMGGHTPSTIAIYLADDKVLFSGDNVVSNVHPYKGQANFKECMAAIEKILEFDADVIVPGHGKVCGKPEAMKLLNYFQQLWDRVQDLKRQGHSKEDVVKRVHDMLSFFPVDPARAMQTSLFFDEGTARMYDEVR